MMTLMRMATLMTIRAVHGRKFWLILRYHSNGPPPSTWILCKTSLAQNPGRGPPPTTLQNSAKLVLHRRAADAGRLRHCAPPAGYGGLLLSPARCLIVRPHADSSKLSYRASVASPALPKSAAGQILPKCGYYAGILLPKMRVRSIQNAGI